MLSIGPTFRITFGTNFLYGKVERTQTLRQAMARSLIPLKILKRVGASSTCGVARGGAAGASLHFLQASVFS